MSDSSSQITLKQLLSRHQRIQIPMVQRDYAQGRTTGKIPSIRTKFISSIFTALKNLYGLLSL